MKLCERGQHCSCFIDGIWNPFKKKWLIYWGDCCKNHDDCYGKLKKSDSTKECDQSMKDCIKEKVGMLAYIMYAFVRTFGRWFK